jgi:ribosomal protein S18 acetylase RimI-like enzyme
MNDYLKNVALDAPDCQKAPEGGHVLIREAILEDIPTLCRLLHELFTIEADFTPERQKQARGLEMLINEGDRSCVMVAELNGIVVGMCSCQLVISTAQGGPSGLLEDLIISHPYRGHGIGPKLLRAIETWAKMNGAARVQLLADRTNTSALEFYLKNEWQRTQLICLRRIQ